ncbi:Ldh family oxidoreductase [Paracraurococcus ruber]|uniref:Dehydrogenase n=1 Tax=Paracraurococcus ruber TaxID=77675 RepID=A0ABS1D2N9_9PROT|nr:Ldh family oxidoreductase [Paracraurococcus ruber]MBK1660890.1 dehydrogenase [Paracraurococcus ruber]TDG26953.1 Ldh family oxidoreductase [Paracraurococcus ruber]
MPKVQAEQLRKIGRALLLANGVPEEEAVTVARHVVNANLAGHDSHGVIMLPNYIERVRVGHIVPGAPFTIVQESRTTTVVDGNWGFGYVINEKAMARTIEKADSENIAACTVFRQGHVGRLASYPLMAAKAGMIGMAWADSGRSPKGVAPFGGREARLGTNPWAIAVPSDLDGPFCMDFATSAVAMGKIKLAEARGQEIPRGWVVDSEGDLTTDPAKIKGGALLPLGGPGEGYKGTALAAMGEVFCGILTGLGFGVEPTGRHNDGCFLIAIKVEAFRPLLAFRKDVADFAHYLKDTRPAKGSSGVLYPGEVEHRAETQRAAEGIEIEDATWAKLGALAREGGVAGELGFG